MKTILKYLPVLACLLVFLPGCGEDTGAEDRLDDALIRMENSMYRLINCEEGDPFECQAYFSQANEMFKETMLASTDSTRIRTANLGAALTEIMQLNEDNELKNIKNRFQEYLDTASIFNKSAKSSPGKPASLNSSMLQFRLNPFTPNVLNAKRENELAGHFRPFLKVALANPPLISEVQSVIRRKVIPAIDYAIARLEFIEKDPAFVFMVSPRMQGDMDSDPREMDMTELKVLHGALLTMRASFRVFNAYNLDVPDYSAGTIAQTLSPGSAFLTLNSGHELSAARTDLMTAADTLIGAIRFLRAETDLQNDDLIKMDTAFMDTTDFDEMEGHLRDISNGLIQNVTVYDVNDFNDSVVVNMGQFFINPIQDFKAKMPDYRILIQTADCGNDLKWKFSNTVFPDPSFNGIFPFITTSTEFKRIFDIDIDTVGLTWMVSQIDGANWKGCDAWGESYGTSLWISGERYIDNDITYVDDHISIDLFNVTGPGTYDLGGISGNVAHYCFDNGTYDRWETDYTHTGSVVITRFDNDVIQGTFSFTGYSFNTITTKTFTAGSFYVRNEENYPFLKQKQANKETARLAIRKK